MGTTVLYQIKILNGYIQYSWINILSINIVLLRFILINNLCRLYVLENWMKWSEMVIFLLSQYNSILWDEKLSGTA